MMENIKKTTLRCKHLYISTLLTCFAKTKEVRISYQNNTKFHNIIPTKLYIYDDIIFFIAITKHFIIIVCIITY